MRHSAAYEAATARIDLDAEIAAAERRLSELKRLRRSVKQARWMVRVHELGLAGAGRPRLPVLTPEQRRLYEKLRHLGIEREPALAEVARG